MKQYSWKSHYAGHFSVTDTGEDFKSYRIENKTGSGEISEWKIFPGLQIVYNSLNMYHCSSVVPLQENVIEISYCLEGSYECDLSDERCFIIGPGDLSVGTVGRTESHGGFPKGRYCGFTLFIEKPVFENAEKRILWELQIDLQKIGSLTGIRKQRFILHRDTEAGQIAQLLTEKRNSESMLPMLRLKVLALLVWLSGPEIETLGIMPSYISREHAEIAARVQKRITEDLTEHVTIEQLKEELHVGTTVLKTAFRDVYGTSIYAYYKDCRLQEAKRLLREEGMPVAEVAARIGYDNPGKFSEAYKKKYGETPGKSRVRTDL